VRELDRRVPLSATAAHWMAILAMDQYAWFLADTLASGVVVDGPESIANALYARRIPVLAASRWLQRADPLPHSWDVTSDSIAAWVAGAVSARTLVVIKPPGASGPAVVDPHFAVTVPPSVRVVVMASDQITAADLA